MDKFAFITHPLNLTNLFFILGKYSIILDKLPKQTIKKILEFLPPYKFCKSKEIKSVLGHKVEGIALLCPLLPEQFIELDSQVVLNKILKAGRLAEKLGAKIVSLAGFSSIFSNQGEDVAKELSIAVTTGNTYTASLVIEGLLKAAELMQLNLKKSTAAIIGATGDIGKICADVLSDKLGRIILVARDQSKLSEFSLVLKQKNNAEINIIRDTKLAASKAEIILTATSAITTLIEENDLKSGTIVCDVSLPPNIARGIIKSRDDILAFEGGYAKLPYFDEMNDRELKKYFPYGAVFGCMAEAIILALEKKFENFSLGRGKITLDKIEEIRAIGKKHGFGLAPFFCGGKLFSDQDIKNIKRNIKYV